MTIGLDIPFFSVMIPIMLFLPPPPAHREAHSLFPH